MAAPAVLVTFDSMKYPNSGFYTFGRNLGEELLKFNDGKFDLSFYVHQRSKYVFGMPVKLVYLSKLHNLFFPGRNQYQLLHNTDQYCRLKPQRVNARRILTIHDLNPIHEKTRTPAKMRKYIRRMQGYIDAADRIVTISHFVKDDVVKYFPEAAGKISVIYNGADRLIVPTGHQPEYKPSATFLFTIGMVNAKKNFHVLPALLHNNDMELIIAGIETDYKERIMAEADRFNCRDRVKILGTISEADKAWYYQNCRALVFPSKAEGFGLPVIEAMHFGKPVFLSTLTSLPEIGGDLAYYFKDFEPEAMQQVLRDGLADYDASQPAQALMEHAAKFNWDDTARQYLTLYQECLVTGHA